MKSFCYRPLTHETAEDFRSVVIDRFGAKESWLADRLLSNPALGSDRQAGVIAYDEYEQPICVLGAIPRRAIFEGKEVSVLNFGTMAIRKGVPRETLLPEIVRQVVSLFSNSILEFSNTASPGAFNRLMQGIGGEGGPASWEGSLALEFKDSRNFLSRLVRSVRLRLGIADKPFDLKALPDLITEFGAEFTAFFLRYLQSAKGLTLSRTAEDLTWVFGERLKKGRLLIRTLVENGVMVGYVVLQPHDCTCRSWMILDLIALDDSAQRLEALLRDACAYLRRETPALYIHLSGFSEAVQKTLRRVLPIKGAKTNNRSHWRSLNLPKEIVNPFEEGWFGGPFDGDLCLC